MSRPLYAHAEPPLLGWIAAPRSIPDAIARGVAELQVFGSDLTAGAGLVIDLATVGLGAAVVVTDDRGVAVEVPALEVDPRLVVVGESDLEGHEAKVVSGVAAVDVNRMSEDLTALYGGEATS